MSYIVNRLRDNIPESYPTFLLALAQDLDTGTEELWFTVDYQTEEIFVSVNCNDFFAWGTSDMEYIGPQHRDLVIETAQELIDLGRKHKDDEESFFPELDLFSLVAARIRGSRPQGAWLHNDKYCDPRIRPLYEAAGEARKSGLFNPVGSPDATEDSPVE